MMNMIIPAILANIPWLKVIEKTPPLINSATRLYDSVSKRQSKRAQRQSPSDEDMQALHAAVKELDERVDSIEASDIEQARIIQEMAHQQAVLARWLVVLASVSAVTAAVAVVALVMAL